MVSRHFAERQMAELSSSHFVIADLNFRTEQSYVIHGILTEGEGSVQLTSSLKVACSVKEVNSVFNIRRS